jgi:hypothetical protein
MVKNQINKKKIYSKKRLLHGGEINTAAVIDDEGIHGITKTGFWVDKEKEIEKLTKEVCRNWFGNLRNHPDFNTRALKTDGSVKGTTNGLENIAICQGYESVGELQKLPVENVDDSAGDGYVVVPETLPVSSVEQTEMPPNCQELERKLTNIPIRLNTIITKLNQYGNKYNTQPVLKQVEEVFDLCAKTLVSNIETSSPHFLQNICKEVSDLCKVLQFNIINLSLDTQELIKKTDKPIGFFIGIEKHHSSGFLTPGFFDTCHSLKLFDDFLNSFIKGVNQKNIVIRGFSSYTPPKRLFLVLLKVGDKYKSSMSGCRISPDKLSSAIERDFLDSGLPDNVYQLLPYDFSEIEKQQRSYTALQAGGSKSRRKQCARKTRRGRNRTTKSKTHCRKHHSRVRKHKKNTYTRRR